MDLSLTFVGTAASVPTANRGLSSALITRGGERFLIDCGEGTQRQLMRSSGLAELDAVFITHLHADHVLGLPGMLKTFGMRDRTESLLIAGPVGLKRFWRDMDAIVGHLGYSVYVEEYDEGEIWAADDYVINAIPTDHGVPSIGFQLVEDDRPGRFDVERAKQLGVTPGADFGVLQRGGEVVTEAGNTVRSEDVLGEYRTGRTVVYSGDTAACPEIRDAAQDATLLVHEATFMEQDAARANATNHSTALQAAYTAAAANVQMLALTHVSMRYMPRDIRAEAQTVFANTWVARDFDVIELPFPERGEPKLVRGDSANQATYSNSVSPE